MTSRTALIAAAVLLAGGNWKVAQGQVTPPTVLTIDTENCVTYQQDVSDVSQFATKSGVTPTAGFRNFQVEYLLGDIVAVNGQSAKGLFAAYGKHIITSPNPDRSVGGAIADTTKNLIREKMFELLTSDGTLVGTIVALGLSGGPPAPGSPAAQTNGGWAIVGGTLDEARWQMADCRRGTWHSSSMQIRQPCSRGKRANPDPFKPGREYVNGNTFFKRNAAEDGCGDSLLYPEPRDFLFVAASRNRFRAPD